VLKVPFSFCVRLYIVPRSKQMIERWYLGAKIFDVISVTELCLRLAPKFFQIRKC
jgi:hypothetical protein